MTISSYMNILFEYVNIKVIVKYESYEFIVYIFDQHISIQSENSHSDNETYIDIFDDIFAYIDKFGFQD